MMRANYEKTETGIRSLQTNTDKLDRAMMAIENMARREFCAIDELTDEEIANTTGCSPDEVAAIVWAIQECPASKVNADSTSWVRFTIQTA
jgi:hypothetical protein